MGLDGTPPHAAGHETAQTAVPVIDGFGPFIDGVDATRAGLHVGEELVAVEGELVWVPPALQEGAAGDVPVVLGAVPLEYAVAALVGLVLVVVWLRRRMDPPSPGVDPPGPD